MYYRLGRAGKALDRFGVIDFATTIAPGVRDVLLTGKVYEAVKRNRRNKNARQYDAVVLDAPPTGRIAQFLNVNSELGRPGQGRARSAARPTRVMTLLRSQRTAVHLVTVLEEMPVQETADGIAELRAARPAGRRRRRQPGPPAGARRRGARRGARPASLDRATRSRPTSQTAGIDADRRRCVDGLLDEAREHAERRALEDEQRERIAELDVPTYELPRLPDGIDLGGLYELAADLCEQGLA